MFGASWYNIPFWKAKGLASSAKDKAVFAAKTVLRLLCSLFKPLKREFLPFIPQGK